ncbi:MAG: nucleotidyltransferase domain-containing protein [Acidobacteriota bacterium]
MDRLDPFCRVLVDACQSVFGEGLKTVAIFGSWARGTASPVSDIDVLIVANGLPHGRMRRLDLFEAMDAATEPARRKIWSPALGVPPLSPILKTPAEVHHGSPLFLDMTEGCRVLWDPEGFFAGYMELLRHRMRLLGTRRRASKGGYYWEYKPGLEPGEVVEL